MFISVSVSVLDHHFMVLNTQSYMWMGLGWIGIGYLPGAVFRSPDGANMSGVVPSERKD